MSLYGRFLTSIWRNLSSGNVIKNSEQLITDVLTGKFPKANVKVFDISGGCGAMYEVYVETTEFQGLSVLKQHKLITDTLKEQIKDMHGVRIHTSIPKNSN